MVTINLVAERQARDVCRQYPGWEKLTPSQKMMVEHFEYGWQFIEPTLARVYRVEFMEKYRWLFGRS